MADETNIRDFVHERFNRLDAKLDRILDAQETANQRLSRDPRHPEVRSHTDIAEVAVETDPTHPF